MWADLSVWIDLKASNTQRKYRAYLGEFCALFGIQPTDDGFARLCNTSTTEIQRYVNWCKARPAQGGRSAMVGDKVSLATVKNKVTVMHSIFEQLLALGAIKTNPWNRERRALRANKGNDRRPHKLVPFEKVSELFSLTWGGSAGLRDKAMLASGFGGGLRSGEILGLRVADVKVGPNGAVALHLRNTKAQRAELQVIPAWAAAFVLEYLKIRRIEGAKDIEPLFINYKGGKATEDPIVDRTFRRMFARYMKRIGLTGEFSPHCMRACAITRLLEKGRSHRDVMKFSRHSSPDMVAHYDKMRHNDAEDVANDLDY